MRVPNEFHDKCVCVIGLGYVGLTLAVAMAEVGFTVIGVERNVDIVSKLKAGKPHFYEPKLADLLRRFVHSGSLKIFNKMPTSQPATTYIITVGTPLDKENKVRLDMVEDAVKDVAINSEGGELVIMRSTLRLGTTRNIVAPILANSQKHFDIAFCPERTVEGQALSELRVLPQIIGGMSQSAALRAANLFQFLTPTVVQVSEPETAEMIKMIDNTHRDISFGFSNEIALVCDNSGVSAVEVIKAGKIGYPRTNLYMPGPVGGPCLSKDTHILSEGLKGFGVDVNIAMTARLLNENQPFHIAEKLVTILRSLDEFPRDPKITLMGLAFKGRPATDDLRGTMAKPFHIALTKYFPNSVYYGYDEMVDDKEISEFGLKPCVDIEDAFANASLVLVLNNHAAYENMPLAELSASMKKPGLVYDLWNNFSASDLDLPKGIGYAGLGNLRQAVLPY